MKAISVLGLALLVSAAPAFADVTVALPTNGSQVVSPFNLSAAATPCSSQPVSAMGYSLDSSSNTTIVNSTAVNAQVTAPLGSHVLHVKSWGNQGASCVTNVNITVVADPATLVPSSALAVRQIETLTNWRAAYDNGTSGSATGTMALVASPALVGNARQFVTTYTNYGGERYYVTFGADTAAQNFLYDGWVYLANPSTGIANLELDMNQVTANGQTVIYGFQCDGWSGTWDYTANTGTPQAPVDQWIHSTATCNVNSWATDTWHHVQIAYSHDAAGNVTYKSVWLDGVQQDLNVTVPSSFALGWGSTLLTNFQVDGKTTSGAATAYLNNLTIYRW